MKKIILALVAMFTFTAVALDTVGVAHATMSSCHAALFIPTYTGGYAWCDAGTGGSVRVKIWCNNGFEYYGPKVYAPHQTSTRYCPSGVTVNAATWILGS